MDSEEPLPDSQISQAQALLYWTSVSADNDGMLGGFPQISKIDLQGSANFLTKLRRRAGLGSGRFERAADCGAGIGRVTQGLLLKFADVVDIVEPVQKFTDEIAKGDPFDAARAAHRIGDIFNVGLEDWHATGEYDVIWNQWCLGQLNDSQLTQYLRRSSLQLKPHGWIVVKENISTNAEGQDVYDEVDSSVTRADVKFRSIFHEAGLELHVTELQRGFPAGLFPVRMYALRRNHQS